MPMFVVDYASFCPTTFFWVGQPCCGLFYNDTVIAIVPRVLHVFHHLSEQRLEFVLASVACNGVQIQETVKQFLVGAKADNNEGQITHPWHNHLCLVLPLVPTPQLHSETQSPFLGPELSSKSQG